MSNAILEEAALPVAAQLAATHASKDVISHGELNLSTGDEKGWSGTVFIWPQWIKIYFCGAKSVGNNEEPLQAKGIAANWQRQTTKHG